MPPTIGIHTTANPPTTPMMPAMSEIRLNTGVGFAGAAAAAPVVAWLHERTGSLTLSTLIMAGLGAVTLGCALAFPDRQEELRPELWGQAAREGGVAVAAE